MRPLRLVAAAFVGLCLALALAHAYTLSGGGKWVPAAVTYSINPTNNDGFTSQQVIDAVAAGYAKWTDLTDGVTVTYSGTTSATTPACTSAHTRNGVNEVIFAPCYNPNNASGIASTMWWTKSDGTSLEKDLLLWDGRAFYLGSGCTGSSAYVDKIINHEIGHVFGLNHTTTAASIMLGVYSWCSNTMFGAASADDTTGIRFLYPPSSAPPTAPAAPTNLRMTSALDTSLALAWNDASTNETSFRLERSADGVTFTEIATLAAGTATYTASSLVSRTTYYFRVRASNAVGNSAYSNIASGTTTTPPPATTLTLVATKVVTGAGQSVSLEWRNSSLRVDIYRNGAVFVTTKMGALAYKDKVGTRSAPFTGSLMYQVCLEASTTCSNTAGVTF